MLTNEYSFSLPTIGLVSKYEQWTIPGYTNRKDNVDGCSGKRGMVRVGGSASRTSGDHSSTDPGGGFCRTKQRILQWQMPAGSNKGRNWAADSQEFPVLGTPPNKVRNTKESDCSAGASTADLDRLPTASPAPFFRKSGRGMRPAQEIRATPHRDVIKRIRGVTKTIVTPLSATAENLTPRKTSRNLTTSCVPTNNELDRYLSRTGPGKIENPHDVIEIDTATVGAAYPTKMNKPVAMADVAGASGPAVTAASGPVLRRLLCPHDGPAEIRPLGNSGIMTNSASCRKLTESEPLEHSVPRVTQCQGTEQSITDVQEQPEEREAIVVGAVGSDGLII